MTDTAGHRFNDSTGTCTRCGIRRSEVSHDRRVSPCRRSHTGIELARFEMMVEQRRRERREADEDPGRVL